MAKNGKTRVMDRCDENLSLMCMGFGFSWEVHGV